MEPAYGTLVQGRLNRYSSRPRRRRISRSRADMLGRLFLRPNGVDRRGGVARDELW